MADAKARRALAIEKLRGVLSGAGGGAGGGGGGGGARRLAVAVLGRALARERACLSRAERLLAAGDAESAMRVLRARMEEIDASSSGSDEDEATCTASEARRAPPLRRQLRALLRVGGGAQVAPQALDDAYWRAVLDEARREAAAPGGREGAAEGAALAAGAAGAQAAPPGDATVRGLLASRGFAVVQPREAALGGDARLLRALMAALARRGWPPVFVFLFPPAWRLVAGAARLAAPALLRDGEGDAGERVVIEPSVFAWALRAGGEERADAAARVGSNFAVPHRDYSHSEAFDADGNRRLLCMWLPVCDVTPSSGCLYALPKAPQADPTFDQPAHPHHLAQAAADDEGTLRLRFDLGAAVPLAPVGAGGAVMWEGCTLHWGAGAAADAAARGGAPPRANLALTIRRAGEGFECSQALPSVTLAEAAARAEATQLPAGGQEGLRLIAQSLLLYSRWFDLDAVPLPLPLVAPLADARNQETPQPVPSPPPSPPVVIDAPQVSSRRQPFSAAAAANGREVYASCAAVLAEVSGLAAPLMPSPPRHWSAKQVKAAAQGSGEEWGLAQWKAAQERAQPHLEVLQTEAGEVSVRAVDRGGRLRAVTDIAPEAVVYGAATREQADGVLRGMAFALRSLSAPFEAASEVGVGVACWEGIEPRAARRALAYLAYDSEARRMELALQLGEESWACEASANAEVPHECATVDPLAPDAASDDDARTRGRKFRAAAERLALELEAPAGEMAPPTAQERLLELCARAQRLHGGCPFFVAACRESAGDAWAYFICWSRCAWAAALVPGAREARVEAPFEHLALPRTEHGPGDEAGAHVAYRHHEGPEGRARRQAAAEAAMESIRALRAEALALRGRGEWTPAAEAEFYARHQRETAEAASTPILLSQCRKIV